MGHPKGYNGQKLLRANLYHVRTKMGLTCGQLSDLAGLNKGYYVRIENGLQNPSYDIMMSICRALHDVNNQMELLDIFVVTDNLNDDEHRVLPTQTKYVSWDETQAIREGYTMVEKAKSELCGNIYNHCILYKLAKNQTMVKCKNFRYGDKVTIIYEDREYQSIFTGLKYNMYDPYYTCVFGKTRIDFTDRMKMYNDKRYRRKT